MEGVFASLHSGSFDVQDNTASSTFSAACEVNRRKEKILLAGGRLNLLRQQT